MAAPKGMNKAFAAGAGALAVAVSALGASVPSHAQQLQPVAANTVNVPIRNAQDAQPEGLRFAAAQQSSGNYQVLVVYGSDQRVIDATIQAAGDAIAEGYPVRGVIIGTASAAPSIDFYAGSQRTATFDSNAILDVRQIKGEIARGNTLMHQVREAALTDTPVASR